MHIIQAPLFDFEAFITTKSNDRLTMVLEALPARGSFSPWSGSTGQAGRVIQFGVCGRRSSQAQWRWPSVTGLRNCAYW